MYLQGSSQSNPIHTKQVRFKQENFFRALDERVAEAIKYIQSCVAEYGETRVLFRCVWLGR